MADVAVTYRFTTGEELEAVCQVEGDYPDAVSEARATAIAAFREAWAVVVATGIEEG